MPPSPLTVRIPPELREDLLALSEAEHEPVSAIIRESIRRYVAVRKLAALRRRVLPFAEAQGLLTDEELFEALG